MNSPNNTIRSFLIQTIDCLRTTSVSKFEAFHIALELLAWAKVSHTLLLENKLRIASTSGDFNERIQRFLEAEVPAQFPGAFTTLMKLNGLNSGGLLCPLVHYAESLASSGALNSPLVDDLIPPLSIGVDTSSIVIPTELAELMIGLGELASNTSVYTPWDFFGSLATRASLAGASAYLESPVHSGIPILIKILTASNLEVRYADPIYEPSAIEAGRLRKFDVSLSFPPIGTRYENAAPDQFQRFPEKTNSGSILALRHLLSQTKKRVVVVVPNTLLFSVGAEKALREALLRKGIIRSVIAMPDGLLENISSGTAVLILDPAGEHEHVRFIDASSNRFHDRISRTRTRLKNVHELSRLALLASTGPIDANAISVSTADLIEQRSNLQVNHYVIPESKKRALQYLKNTQTVALKDLVTTVRPLPLTSLKTQAPCYESFEVLEIGAADLPQFGFISQPRRRIELPASTLSEHSTQFLRPHDIVLTIKGSVGKVGIVPDTVSRGGAGGWIVGQSAIVLRSTEFPPIALFMFLRSPLGQTLLQGVASGATTPLIQLGQLLSLQIPNMSESEQLQAIEALMREREIQHELNRLQDEQANIAIKLWSLG